MAVHPAMPGLSVTISIDGTAAPEFGSASELSDIYRCYINCRSGAKYSIDVSLDSGFVWADNSNSLIFTVYIDGREVGWFYVSKPTQGPSNQSLRFDHRCMTEADGSASPQYFVFSELSSVEVADDHTIKADKKRIKSMGSIDLRISRARARGRVRFNIPGGRRQATTRTVVGSQALGIAGKALAQSKRNLTHGTLFKAILTKFPVNRSSPTMLKFTNKVYLGQIIFHYSSHKTHLPLDNSLQTNAKGCVVIDLTRD